MLTQICAELHNYFSRSDDRITGTYKIVDGKIVPSVFIQNGQYFRIVGSVFNDGVHQYFDNPPQGFGDVLKDELEFDGEIWLMSVPKDLIDLVADIKEWQQKNADAVSSPYQSESFGGYSYTKASSNNGGGYSWQDAFASRLNQYRKVSVL